MTQSQVLAKSVSYSAASAFAMAMHLADPWAIKYVEPVFQGDPSAAFSLAIALSNEKRGRMAVILWRAKVASETFRVFLGEVWMHDHRHVIEAAGTRRRLTSMFSYAEFPTPPAADETFLAWRGTFGVSVDQARRGFSWTLDRDIACWFAMRFDRYDGTQLVLVTEITAKDIAYYTDDREEREVVLLKAPRASIDGTVTDWLDRYTAVKTKRQLEKF